MRIDLNADMGEGVGDDEALLEIVTSANLATGAHAGGGAVLERAVAAAARRGVAIGAHPSYRDRVGFGRASHLAVLHRDVSARSHVVGDLVEQILVVAHEAERQSATLAHVKAHGSLYNEAVHDPVAAQVVADAVLGAEHALGHRVALVTQPGGELAHIAARHGLVVIAEGFADRGYLSTGQLVPRTEPGAVLADTSSMAAQALDLASGNVDPVDGPRIPVLVDSLCVHGDTPGAVAAAQAIRAALEARGWQVVAPSGHVQARRRASAAQRLLAFPALESPATGPALTRAEGEAWAEGGADPLTILPFGDRALLVEPPGRGPSGTQWVLRVAARARQQWPRASVVPGLASVLVAFDRPTDRPDPHGPEARGVLSGRWLAGKGTVAAGDGTAVPGDGTAVPGDGTAVAGEGDPGSDSRVWTATEGHSSPVVVDSVDPTDRIDYQLPVPARLHMIPTRYDGPDLADVAEMLRLPAAEVVRRHGAAIWTVAAIGFSPGFGYLTTTDPIFSAVGRRADPRTRVPRGSVALAAQMCAIYPSATPGGWQLIGTTAAELFDVSAEHPALLRVGDRVEFVEVR